VEAVAVVGSREATLEFEPGESNIEEPGKRSDPEMTAGHRKGEKKRSQIKQIRAGHTQRN